MKLLKPFKQLFTAILCAAALSSFAEAPFTVSADGAEVSDAKTGLIWRRCAEGMTAGTSVCTGTASGYTHEAALARARSQTGWRLPNVQELSSIADLSRLNPAIDGVAFPATCAFNFWSSSPVVGDAQNAWVVYFYNGLVYYVNRNDANCVRLVRAGP